MSHSRHQTLCHSTPSLERFKSGEVDLIIKYLMASNSWKTYKTAVEAFIQFRLIYKFGNIWPASVDEIAIFIAFLSYKGLAATTVTTYISVLDHAHKIKYTDNTSFIVYKMLEGLRRKSPSKLDVRTPISFHLLNRLIHSLSRVCNSQYEARLFSSAFSIAYFAMLRVSELAVKSSSDESGPALNYENVRLTKINGENELHIKIYSSKTDQR